MLGLVGGDSGLEIRILGAVELRRNEVLVDIGGPTLQRLLGFLTGQAGTTISDEHLMRVAWDEERPATATRTLQSHLSRLRQCLSPEATIEARRPGYRLVVGDATVDAIEFERAVERALYEPAAIRARTLANALENFRGEPFGEWCDRPWARAAAVRLEELRLGASEAWMGARLELGGDGALVGDLEALVARAPSRELPWCLLVVALARSGRRAEALRRAADMRTLLRDEYGLDPSATIAAIERQILDDATDISLPTSAGAPRARSVVPAFLVASADALVGRDNEIGALRTAWSDTAEGRVQHRLLDGEAGIGKTSLCSGLAQIASQSGGLVAAAECDEYAGASLAPWLDILRQVCAQLGPALDAILASADAAVVPLAPLAPLAPLVAMLPELAPSFDAIVVPTDADDVDRRVVFDAVVSFLVRSAELRPILIVLDDLQWADDATLLLFRRVVRYARGSRVMVLATTRTGEVEHAPEFARILAGLSRMDAFQRIHLAPFALDETKLLVEALVARSDAAEQSIDAIDAVDLHQLGDGNPFFITQLVADVLDRDDRIEPAGAWRVPETIRDVVDARLARLGDETRQLLVVGAIVGRRFDLRIAAAAAEVALLDATARVDRARAAGLVVERADQRFEFVHALVTASLLESISTAHRCVLHRRIAELFEMTARADIEDDVVTLAYHWFEAARYEPVRDRALHYSLLAARAALTRFAWEQARYHCNRALDLSRQPAPDLDAEWEACFLLAHVEREIGDGRALAAAVASACAIASDLDDPVRFARAVLLVQSRETIATNRDETAALFVEALARLGRDDSPERALIMAAWSEQVVESGVVPVDIEPLERQALDAIAMGRRLGVPDIELETLERYARFTTGLPGARARREHAHDMQDRLANGTPSYDVRAGVLAILAEADARLGDRSELEAVLAARADLAARIPGISEAAWVPFIEGVMALFDGDFDVAAEATRLAMDKAPRWPSITSACADRLMRISWLAGDTAELEQQLEIARAVEHAFPQVTTLRALHAIDSGRVGEAAALVGPLLREAGSFLPWSGGRPRLLHDLAELTARTDDAAGARVVNELLRPYAGELLCSYLITIEGAADTYLGVTEHLLGDLDAAAAHFATGLELEERFGGGIAAATTRVWWANLLRAHPHLDSGSRAATLLDEAAHFARAHGVVRILRLIAQLQLDQ